MRRVVLGSLAGVTATAVLSGAMLPFRSHLSIATAGLVLVIPVVAGVTTGGYAAGLLSVAVGFLAYDFVFIPPFYTLSVGSRQNWLVLAVYAVVMLLVARVVAGLEQATAASQARALGARRLSDLSELLLSERGIDDLARIIVRAVHELFEVGGVALLLDRNQRLEVAATAGEPIGDDGLAALRRDALRTVALSTDTSEESVQTLALVTSGRPVGLLVLTGVPPSGALRELLPTLANQLAMALERAQMQELVRQAALLKEVDRLRHALVGAVSHDLRTPLATIKVASSTLVNPALHLSDDDTRELHSLIDAQTDRLTAIVNSVLDMTRIQAGVLRAHCEPWSLLDIAANAVSLLRPLSEDRLVEVNVPAWLPLVDVDHLLVEQVLYNLLDNADRHGPPGTPITIAAEMLDSARLQVSVTDRGPGIPPGERDNVFDSFVRFDSGGRAGLGLAIAKAFIAAHGEKIWAEEPSGPGARIVFTLPVVTQPVAST